VTKRNNFKNFFATMFIFGFLR